MDIPGRTLVDRLYEHGRRRPNDPALQDPTRLYTWQALDRHSNRIANALLRAGLRKGGRVALLTDTGALSGLVILATLKAGGSAVPVPTLIAPDAIARVIEDSGAQFLFLSAATRGLLTAHAPTIQCRRIAIDFSADGWISLDDFIGDSNTDRPRVEVEPHDEFNIIYSSGTTGRPKGIVHDHALRASAALELAPLAFPAGVRTLTTTALYSNWTMGALIYTLWAGGCVRFIGKFSPSELVRVCGEFEPGNVYLVPVQIERLLGDAASLALVRTLRPSTKWSAGSYLAPTSKRALLDNWRGGLIEIYGMTEGAPFTILKAHERPDKLHTVGQSDPPEDLKIIDDTGNELPIGERGEIVGRVRHVMSSYNNNDEATRALLWHDANGVAYFRSGDIGVLDGERFLQVTDRKKDMIISGGFNIYASDLEEVLRSHPAVAQVAVFGVPSRKWGETPVAAVVTKIGAAISEAELLSWTNQRLGRLQRLAAVVILKELPRGSLDKVLKRDLRTTYAYLGDTVSPQALHDTPLPQESDQRSRP